jgi:NAD(P)-dependent dehydrogenase (short-subunit alcohol dehydrogenase family)
MLLAKQKIVVIGGSSGIGKAVAKTAVEQGANVIIISRSVDKLQQTANEIGGNIQGISLDITDENAVKQTFAEIGQIDHLVLSGFPAKPATFKKLGVTETKAIFDEKFWAVYAVAKYAQVNQTGSIVFFSGIFSRKPPKGYATITVINSAIEGLARALAVELAPIRVNVISPGLTDTPAYSGLSEQMKQGYFEKVKNSLPVGRVGTPEDMANVALMMMTNPYLTGTILDVDGGAMLVKTD